MKKTLAQSLAVSLFMGATLFGGAALAQEDGIFGAFSDRSEDRGVPVINVYFDDTAPQGSKTLSDAILKELERSIYFEIVPSPVDATRITAPTSLAIPANGKGKMKVGFQIAFPRGSDMDFSVSCDYGKPQDCGRAIKLRSERLYRDYLLLPKN